MNSVYGTFNQLDAAATTHQLVTGATEPTNSDMPAGQGALTSQVSAKVPKMTYAAHWEVEAQAEESGTHLVARTEDQSVNTMRSLNMNYAASNQDAYDADVFAEKGAVSNAPAQLVPRSTLPAGIER